MRSQAIENCAKLMANAHRQGDKDALDQYCAKLSILCDREDGGMYGSSVIRELVNQKVELNYET